MLGIGTYIAGGFVLVLLIALGVQSYRLTDTERLLNAANTDVTRLTDNNAILIGNQQTCQASITDQNKAIAANKAASDKVTADAQAAVDKAKGDSAKANANLIAVRAQLASMRPAVPELQACQMALIEARNPEQ